MTLLPKFRVGSAAACLALGVHAPMAARAQGPDQAMLEADRADWCLERHRRAQAERREQRLLSASEALRECLTPMCSPVLREDCARLLTEVERDVPSVVFVAESEQGDLSNVTVYDGEHRIATALDGDSVELDPGEHHFTFHSPGMASATRSVVLRVGEQNRRVAVRLVSLHVEPANAAPAAVPTAPAAVLTAPAMVAPPSDHTLTYALFGAGTALGLGGLWLALSAKSDYDEAETRCAPLCSERSQDRIRYKSLAADGLFVLSGATLAIAVVRLFAMGESGASASVWLGPGQVAARGRF